MEKLFLVLSEGGTNITLFMLRGLKQEYIPAYVYTGVVTEGVLLQPLLYLFVGCTKATSAISHRGRCRMHTCVFLGANLRY